MSSIEDTGISQELPSEGSGDTVRELTEHRISVMAVLSGGERSGAAIKSELSDYYGEEVTHGQLYNNLDSLDECGLIECRRHAIDKRTNAYRLTPEGFEVLAKRTQWLNSQLTGGQR